ncbi:hypothetical protein [Persephonella sp.]
MRYAVQHKKSSYINTLVVLFSLSVYLFLAVFLVYKYLAEEVFPSDIYTVIAGKPEEYIEGLTFLQITEKLHTEVFLLGMVYLTIFSINLRVSINEKLKNVLTICGFLCLILYCAGILLVKTGIPASAYVYTFSFLSLVFIFTVVNTLNIYGFTRGKRK